MLSFYLMYPLYVIFLSVCELGVYDYVLLFTIVCLCLAFTMCVAISELSVVVYVNAVLFICCCS